MDDEDMDLLLALADEAEAVERPDLKPQQPQQQARPADSQLAPRHAQASCALTKPNGSCPGMYIAGAQGPPPARSQPQGRQVTDGYVDRISGFRVSKPVIGSLVLKERLTDDCVFIKLKDISPHREFIGRWATMGVLVSKVQATSRDGSSYNRWSLSDLDGKQVTLFLWRKAVAEHYREPEGSVLLIWSPQVKKDEGGGGHAGHAGFSLHIDKPEMLQRPGMSPDFGMCRGTRKDGQRCTIPINKSVCEYCPYHAQAALRALSSNRADMAGANLLQRQLLPQARAAQKQMANAYGKPMGGINNLIARPPPQSKQLPSSSRPTLVAPGTGAYGTSAEVDAGGGGSGGAVAAGGKRSYGAQLLANLHERQQTDDANGAPSAKRHRSKLDFADGQSSQPTGSKARAIAAAKAAGQLGARPSGTASTGGAAAPGPLAGAQLAIPKPSITPGAATGRTGSTGPSMPRFTPAPRLPSNIAGLLTPPASAPAKAQSVRPPLSAGGKVGGTMASGGAPRQQQKHGPAAAAVGGSKAVADGKDAKVGAQRGRAAAPAPAAVSDAPRVAATADEVELDVEDDLEIQDTLPAGDAGLDPDSGPGAGEEEIELEDDLGPSTAQGISMEAPDAEKTQATTSEDGKGDGGGGTRTGRRCPLQTTERSRSAASIEESGGRDCGEDGGEGEGASGSHGSADALQANRAATPEVDTKAGRSSGAAGQDAADAEETCGLDELLEMFPELQEEAEGHPEGPALDDATEGVPEGGAVPAVSRRPQSGGTKSRGVGQGAANAGTQQPASGLLPRVAGLAVAPSARTAESRKQQAAAAKARAEKLKSIGLNAAAAAATAHAKPLGTAAQPRGGNGNTTSATVARLMSGKVGAAAGRGRAAASKPAVAAAPAAMGPSSALAAAFGNLVQQLPEKAVESRYSELSDEAAGDAVLAMLEGLEARDALVQQLDSVKQLKVTAWHCVQCDRLFEYMDKQCRADGHTMTKTSTLKRFWTCDHCNARITTLGVRFPASRCSRCNNPSLEFTACTMYRGPRELKPAGMAAAAGMASKENLFATLEAHPEMGRRTFR